MTAKTQMAKSKAEALPLRDLAHDRVRVLLSILFAMVLGAGLLTAAGFAQASHDAAHDSRHSFAFPCH